MQNIKELRESLLENYNLLSKNEIEIRLAKQLANTAGKILNSCKLEMVYNAMTSNNKKIKFLEVE